MTGREQVAQRPPTVALQDFPTYLLGSAATVHRAHSRDRGPWWFSSSGQGRFDLPAPGGTSYLADSPVSALRERLGTVLGESSTVPASLLEDSVVSALSVPEDVVLADLESAIASRFGVTRELGTMVPYAVPQAWARGFREAQHDGVRYAPRFSTGDTFSYAVFGPSGASGWPADDSPVPAARLPGAPVALEPPRRWDLTVVRPPRTGAR